MSKFLQAASLTLATVFATSAQAEPDHRANACEAFTQSLYDSSRNLNKLLARGIPEAGEFREIYEDREYNSDEKLIKHEHAKRIMISNHLNRLRHHYELTIEEAKKNIEEVGCYEITPMSSLKQKASQRRFG